MHKGEVVEEVALAQVLSGLRNELSTVQLISQLRYFHVHESAYRSICEFQVAVESIVILRPLVSAVFAGFLKPGSRAR